MSSFFRRALPVVGAIAGSALLPGVGTALGAGISSGLGGAIGGAFGGALSGGGVRGAGLGALGGYAFGGAPGLGEAASSALGTTSAAGQAAITSGIQGAGLGLATGEPSNAVLGAGLGAVGGYLSAGGSVPGLGSLPGSTLDTATGVAGMQGPTQGSGVLGSLGSLTGGAGPMKLGSLLQAGGNLLDYATGQSDIEEMHRLLEAQAARAEAQFQPYSQAGQQALANLQAPSMEALQADPGYQFRLQEGNRALERSLAAQGLSGSGAALRAAQEYGQGLADQTYNDYFNRQGQIANYGYGAASGLGGIYGSLGNVQAAAQLAEIENRNRAFGSLGNLAGLF